MEGYFKIHRQIFDSWVFTDEKALKIWVWLIGKARHKDGFVNVTIGKGQSSIKLTRGQLLFGRFSAEEALNLNGSLIYRQIQKFEKEGMINIKSNSHYTIITICKYNEFQTDTEENRTAIEQPLNNQRTAIEQPLNTNKNDNNYKKDKNVKNKDIDFSDYNFSDNVIEKIKEFIRYRNEIKKKLTETSVTTLLKKS